MKILLTAFLFLFLYQSLYSQQSNEEALRNYNERIARHKVKIWVGGGLTVVGFALMAKSIHTRNQETKEQANRLNPEYDFGNALLLPFGLMVTVIGGALGIIGFIQVDTVRREKNSRLKLSFNLDNRNNPYVQIALQF